MMKQSKKTGKLLACLLTLALSCAAAGCGNGNDGKGQEASAAPEADSQAPESIGAGADVDTQLDTEPDKEAEGSSELLGPEDTEVASTGTSDPVIHIEEQELYNADGIVVTLPEQTLQYSSEPEIHLENSNDFDLYISFMDLTVDGELIQEGSHNTSDAFVSANGSSDSTLPVREILSDTIYSDRESGEITFVLFLTENQNETFGEAAVTIPYTITRE